MVLIASMPEAPQGTITFVFTDIVGSTRLWEKFPADMGNAIRQHDALLREIFEASDGYVFKTVGDAFCVAFELPSSAVRAVVEVQRQLAAREWGALGSLVVRAGVHSGPAEFRNKDYFGGTLNRAARIEAAAHGGQILVSGVTRDLLQDDPTESVGFRDLGAHRLRSLERPEQLFQILAEGLTPDFPAPKSMEVLPNNLPIQTTSFIGRDKEMDSVSTTLESRTRLLTLVGTGGTGKTRLAIEAGARLIGAFPDGVWLVELALVSDASRLLQTLTDSLGLREEPGRPLLETLLGFLRSKKLLLILDNCEQLTGSVASIAAELLRTCPSLKILATSRHSLGLAGEGFLPVPPLGILDSHREELGGPGFAARVAGYDAVKLFVERAAAVHPEFTVTTDNAPAIAEICSRLDGIPLAIELAAARVRLLDVNQIAERLVDRFRLLRGGHADRLPHQQTLQALIDWSYDLLSDAEKLVFCRMGVFIGGRSLEAIEFVCSSDGVEEEDVLDLLQQLIEKSLVSVEVTENGTRRYTMLESVWHYARNKLKEQGTEEQFRDRHLEYFLKTAEEAEPHYLGPDQKRWLEAFNDDIFNFEAAVNWSLTSSRPIEALRFLSALGRPLEVRGFLTEIHQLFPRIFEKEELAPPGLRAKATASAARLAWAMDSYEEAAGLFAKSEALATEAGDRDLAGMCHAFLGFLDRSEGRIDAAEARFRLGLAIASETGSLSLRAMSLSGIGRVAMSRGELGSARAMSEESLGMYRTLGDQWVIGLILWGIARVAIAQKDVSRAESALCEWTSILQALGNTWILPYVIETFGAAALASSESDRAAWLFGGAAAMRERMGSQLTPDEKADHDRDMENIAAQLDMATKDRLWNEGASASDEELLSRARRKICDKPM